VIRMNSLIRGHSGVRWELIEKMGELLRNNITPMVPLRGSISASGGNNIFFLVLFSHKLTSFLTLRSITVVVYRWNTGRKSFYSCF